MRLLKQLIQNISEGTKNTVRKIKDTLEDLTKKELYPPEYVINLVKKSGNKDERSAYRTLIYGLTARILTNDFKYLDEDSLLAGVKGYSLLERFLHQTKDNIELQRAVLKNPYSKIVYDFFDEDVKLIEIIHNELKFYIQITSQLYAHYNYKQDTDSGSNDKHVQAIDREYTNISNKYFSRYTQKYDPNLVKHIFEYSYPKIKIKSGNLPYLILYLDDQNEVHIIDKLNIIPYGLAGIVEGKIRENYELLKNKFGLDENISRVNVSGKTRIRRKSSYYYSDDKNSFNKDDETIFDISAGLSVIMWYILDKGGRIIISAKEQKIFYFVSFLLCLFNVVSHYKNAVKKGKNFNSEISKFSRLVKQILEENINNTYEQNILKSSNTGNLLKRYEELEQTTINLVFNIGMHDEFSFSKHIALDDSLDLFLLLSYLLGYTDYKKFAYFSTFSHSDYNIKLFFDYIHFIRLAYLRILNKGSYKHLILLVKDFYENLELGRQRGE